jgi:hypothetical protein
VVKTFQTPLLILNGLPADNIPNCKRQARQFERRRLSWGMGKSFQHSAVEQEKLEQWAAASGDPSIALSAYSMERHEEKRGGQAGKVKAR